MSEIVEYRVEITNPAGSSIVCDPVGRGDPAGGVAGYQSIQLSPRYKQAGPGTIECRAVPDLLAAVKTPGNRVVVRRHNRYGDTSVEMSGPIEQPLHGYTVQDDGVDGHGKLTVGFADDLARSADRLVFPDPAHDLSAQTLVRYTVSAGSTEDAMRALFTIQCGPGAPLTWRRLPGVVLGADHGITLTQAGTSFTKDVYVNDALRRLAVAAITGGIGLGFRLVQVGAGVQFQVWQPRDLTHDVVFSRELGNLVELADTLSAPTCTVAYAGDATAGIGRVIRKRVNQPALDAGWGVHEQFVDGRSAANAAELDQMADKALADGAPKRRVVAVVRETPLLRWRYEMDLGDMVTVIVGKNDVVTRQIIGADYNITADGEKILPIIGEDGDDLTDAQAAQLLKQDKRIAAIEGAL